jgi:hypothetical protein
MLTRRTVFIMFTIAALAAAAASAGVNCRLCIHA